MEEPPFWGTRISQPKKVELAEVIDTFINYMKRCYHHNTRALPLQRAVSYGDGNQKIDIWGDENKSNAAMVLFHGGYWQEGDRELFTSPVKTLIDEGFVVGCVGYDLATAIPLSSVIQQAANALSFLEKRWPWKQLSVGGHSAGAHLALSAVRLEQSHRYQKVVLFSGIYDLRPLVGTYIGQPINLTADQANAASIDHLDELSAELLAIAGAEESPTFKEQSQRIVQHYLRKHCHLKLSDCYKVIPCEDHFSLITSLADKRSAASKELLHFMLPKHPPEAIVD